MKSRNYLTGILLLLYVFSFGSICAQDISGKWYSEDGTRQYEIRKQADGWAAVLIRSSRPDDKPGFAIISQLQQHGKSWKGLIHSVADSSMTAVSIRYNAKKNDKLKLKLSRMVILDVSIRWYRQDPAEAEKNMDHLPPPPPPPGEF